VHGFGWGYTWTKTFLHGQGLLATAPRLGAHRRKRPRRPLRGRSERAFRTLQDRLPKELAIAGITTIAAAGRYLREVFVPAYNTRFAVAPEQPGSAFVAIRNLDLDQILCLEEPRQVGNDDTVLWRRRRLQIPASPLRPHFVRARVKVRQHLDGTLSIFHGPRCICPIRARWTDHCLGRLTPLGGRASLWICG
jgi:hypothetical protein